MRFFNGLSVGAVVCLTVSALNNYEGSALMPAYDGPIYPDTMGGPIQTAVNTATSRRDFSNMHIKLESNSLLPRRDLAKGPALRILPLGDSITDGSIGSGADKNGYRLALLNLLRAAGAKVDYIGSQRTGSMTDNQHEGYPGNTISEISNKGQVTARQQPNVILVHAGTNDLKNNNDAVSGAPDRFRALVDRYMTLCPNATMIVAQIITARDTGTQNRIVVYNNAIEDVVNDFKRAGKRISIANMSQSFGTSDLYDVLHPNEGGYVKMSQTWFAAIKSASDNGDIVEAPIVQEIPPQLACASPPDWKEEGVIATGGDAASSDGPFVANWDFRGTVASGVCDSTQLRFMDLDGDGRKDYACLRDDSRVDVWINRVNPSNPRQISWQPMVQAASGVNRDPAGVFFADMNGDGRDDYLWVDEFGNVDLWINTGWDGVEWGWRSMGNVGGGVGATRETIRFVDIDGDGRADYLMVHPVSGQVTAWLNWGVSNRPSWRPLGVIASGVAAGHRVQLGDFTGNGRADYMWIHDNGQVYGYTNNRRRDKGLIPLWINQGIIADRIETSKKIWLVDLDGDGKLDYVAAQKDNGALQLWVNNGSGGNSQAGDGVFICDLDGDGLQDYFWLNTAGVGWGYINQLDVSKGNWGAKGMIASGVNAKRENVRMAVMTKSGRADYLVVDESSGRTLMWENQGIINGVWSWKARGEIARGGQYDIGRTFEGKYVHFADLNGDGFDDYIYVDKTGNKTTVWFHRGTDDISFTPPKIAISGIQLPGIDIQFADLNGDGLADYVYVDRVDGVASVWTNLGEVDGSISWQRRGVLATGVGMAGASIKFGDMYGNGRDAYLGIHPDDGSIRMWNNNCLKYVPPPSSSTITAFVKRWLGILLKI